MVLAHLRAKPGETRCSEIARTAQCIRATHKDRGHIYIAEEYGLVDEDVRRGDE